MGYLTGGGVAAVGGASTPTNQLVRCMQKRKLALFGALPFPPPLHRIVANKQN